MAVPLRASVAGAIGWIVLVLAGFAISAVGISSTQQTLGLTAQTRRLVVLADAWKRIRIWLIEEETRERKYLVEHDRSVGSSSGTGLAVGNDRLDRPYHRVAVATVEKLLVEVRAESPAGDVLQIDRCRSDNARYGRAMLAMFDAVDRGDRRAVASIHEEIDPAYDEMEAIARGFEVRYGHDDYLALAALEHTQQRVAVLFPYLIVVGVLGSLASFFVFRHFRSRANAMVAANMQRLEAAALVDALTGLGNHRAFREARDGAGPRAGDRCHLALVDIDHFKSFNDRYGHVHGDGVLRHLGAILAGEAAARAYRIGGDEFVMIFEDGSPADVVSVLERIRDAAPRKFLGSLSIGVATLDPGETIDSAYERADLALYEAKHRGRNRVVAFDATLLAGSTTIASRRLTLERVLGRDRPVDIVFQPIAMLDGTHVGYEALARFPLAFASPREAFEIAARLDRTIELDTRCIDGVAAALDSRSDVALAGSLFINVCPVTLASGAAFEHLETLRARTRLPAERIVIEITEHEPLDDAARAQAAYVRRCGYRIALDDTGSGNAGLATLATMAIDILKIDRAIVARLDDDAGARATAAGLLTIARLLDYDIVCEGVEDEASVARCRELARAHGDAARFALQGYAIGRPAPFPGRTAVA